MKCLNQKLYKIGFISEDDCYFFKITHDVEAAVKEITGFYRIYDSARWVGEKLVIRLARALTATGVAELNDKFADVLRRGAIVQSRALPQERNEPEVLRFPRPVLTPHRRTFGRSRQF